MDSAEVRVFKEADQIAFGCFLQSKHSGGLEAEISLVVRSDFPDESLEGKFSDEKIGLCKNKCEKRNLASSLLTLF